MKIKEINRKIKFRKIELNIGASRVQHTLILLPTIQVQKLAGCFISFRFLNLNLNLFLIKNLYK
jgi:hypothetical protein